MNMKYATRMIKEIHL